MTNWPVTILSDQLTVRPFSSPEAWKPGPLKVQSDSHAAPQTPKRRQQQLHPDMQSSKLLAPDIQAMLITIVSIASYMKI